MHSLQVPKTSSPKADHAIALFAITQPFHGCRHFGTAAYRKFESLPLRHNYSQVVDLAQFVHGSKILGTKLGTSALAVTPGGLGILPLRPLTEPRAEPGQDEAQAPAVADARSCGATPGACPILAPMPRASSTSLCRPRRHAVEVALRELRRSADSAFLKRVATQRTYDRYQRGSHLTDANWIAAGCLWSLAHATVRSARVIASYDAVRVDSQRAPFVEAGSRPARTTPRRGPKFPTAAEAWSRRSWWKTGRPPPGLGHAASAHAMRSGTVWVGSGPGSTRSSNCGG